MPDVYQVFNAQHDRLIFDSATNNLLGIKNSRQGGNDLRFDPANVAITGGTIQLNNGSATVPSLGFASFPNYGIFLDIVNGGPVFTSGGLPIAGAINSTLSGYFINSSIAFGWGTTGQGIGNPDLLLYRDTANTLAQRNSTTAQKYSIYNTFTNATNYERGVFDWQTTPNLLRIGAEAAGTGVQRSLALNVTGRTLVGGITDDGVTTFQVNGAGKITGQLTSTVATGTAPLVVASTTAVANLTASNVTTNANLTGPITSVGNATSVASQTGTGSTFVMNTSPTLITPALGAATGTSLNLGAVYTVTRLAKFTASLSPVAVAANTTAEQLFTVTGIAVGDVVNVDKPTAQAGLGIVGVRASAANQVGITFSNNTAAAITPTAAETYLFSVIQ